MVKYDAQIVPLLKILVNQIFKQLREGPAVTISYFHSQCIDSAPTTVSSSQPDSMEDRAGNYYSDTFASSST